MTDEGRKRAALAAAARRYHIAWLSEDVEGQRNVLASLLEAARAWVAAEEAEKRKPVIHLETTHGMACGLHCARGTTRSASTYHKHVTCKQCQKTVAFGRAGGKRET